MTNTDIEWEKWGKQDPYYGVVSSDKFTRENIEANREEFFLTGERFVSKIISKFERSFGELPTGNALDFGCGVGRLTLALALRFNSVIGVDISPSMLAEATSNAKSREISNANFALSDEGLSNAPGQYDFVNSYIVIQHIPVERGMKYIELLLGKVRPGGGFLIHFSVRDDSAVRKFKHWIRRSVPFAEMAANIVSGRPPSAPAMQMNAYRLADVIKLLESVGVTETLMFTERHGPVLTVGLVGKKP